MVALVEDVFSDCRFNLKKKKKKAVSDRDAKARPSSVPVCTLISPSSVDVYIRWLDCV